MSNSEDIADLIGSVGFCIVCYKAMYNRQHFSQVLTDLTDFTRFGKPTTFDAEIKKCRLFASCFAMYTASGVTLYAILSKFETRHGPCMRHQAETSDDLYCSSVYPIWIPFKVNKILLFLVQLAIAVEIYTPSGQIISMMYEEVSLLVLHMNSFTVRLRNVFREKEGEKRSRMLAFCAEYHSNLINSALEIDGLQRNITGHLVLVWAVSMGCIANQLMSMYKPVGAVLYLAGYILSLPCFVISGQKLQTESEAIAEELYYIPWHLGSIEEQKVVMFMMMRAQTPLTLSAKPFGNYENALFVTAI
ncbi:unnamed protein product [Callosobruchus maculatus]|uniref:Odorant receptor n=1 Tax=Callosobruchus maculatus TaxID=64391 RepID=A0A653C4U6_CALMS|nr:unnamed protein product [Callosobruchus maculatus]